MHRGEGEGRGGEGKQGLWQGMNTCGWVLSSTCLAKPHLSAPPCPALTSRHLLSPALHYPHLIVHARPHLILTASAASTH